MQKLKVEIILIIILIPILTYVGWQAYNTYFKPTSVDLEDLEIREEFEKKPTPPRSQYPEPEYSGLEKKTGEPQSAIKGTLDYTGYIERDPLEHSLPVEIKKEKPPPEKEISIKKKEPFKEIILPKFNVTGIVWGKTRPRAIIDNKVYKTGDIIKGAKILGITERGIHIIYEEKEFWITIQQEAI